MAPTIRNILKYGELRRSLFVNAHNKDDYTRHRGQTLYGMALTIVNTHVIGVTPGAVYTAQGLRIYLDATDGQVDLSAVVPDAFNLTYQQSNLPLCVMVYLSYTFTADQVAQGINVTSYSDAAGAFTLSARIVPFDLNTGAPVYNLLPLDPVYLDVAQPSDYTSLQNWNGPAISAPSGMDVQNQAIQFGEIPLGYILIGVDPATSTPPTGLSSAGVSIVSYDNAFNMVSDLVGQDALLPLQPNDVSYTLVSTPSGTAQYQGYSAKTLTNGLTAATLVRPAYGTPNAISNSHLDSDWATYRQPNFLKDGVNVLEAFRRMDVVLRQWLDFTGNQSLISITQDSAATFASGNLPLQASVDAILAVFDGGLTAATNANLVVWPTVTTGLDTGTPTNRTVKGGLIPHVENTLLGKLTTNEGDSTRSAIAALDTAIFVTLTAALGVTASRAQLRDPTTSALTVNLTSPTLASPTMTGVPISTTNATATDASFQVATDGFVQNAIAHALAYAPVLGTTAHGVATAVTNSTPTDSSTQVATNAFVQQALANSPALGVVPTAPTAANPGAHANDTTIATTAFVTNAINITQSSFSRTFGPGAASVGINNGSTAYVTAIVIISACAGGGGGAGDNSGSGAAGAGCNGLVLFLGSTDVINITIGSHGAGGSASGSGTAGSNTTISVTSGSVVIIDAVLEGGAGGVYNDGTGSDSALGGRVKLGKTMVDGSGYVYVPATAYYSNDGQNFYATPVANTSPTFGPWTSGQNGTANANNTYNVAHSGGDSIFGRTPVGASTITPGSGGNAGANAAAGADGGNGLVTMTVIKVS